MKKNFKSLKIPKDQGIPLIETTIFSFAKGAIEHNEKEGWDVLTFTPDNCFASYNSNSIKFSEIMSIEICTAAPWFAGYRESIANVKVEYSFPKKQGELLSIKLKQI